MVQVDQIVMKLIQFVRIRRTGRRTDR